MKYTTMKIGGKEYKLRLTVLGTVRLEKELGKSPLQVIADGAGGVPPMESLIKIIQYSLYEAERDFDFKAVCGLVDEFFEEGNGLDDLITVISEIFKSSGFIKDKPEAAEKN